VNPVTYLGTVLVIVTQVLAIALAAILTGVVATAYTAQVQRREAIYELEVREVLADGVVSDEEKQQLKALQAKYGMSDEQVDAIARQVNAEKAEKEKAEKAKAAQG
jgi:voltage-gated potassium channel